MAKALQYSLGTVGQDDSDDEKYSQLDDTILGSVISKVKMPVIQMTENYLCPTMLQLREWLAYAIPPPLAAR